MSLNQNNPPLPPDFLANDADWRNVSSAIILPGQSLNVPTSGGLSLPPVYGHGKLLVVSFFQGWTPTPVAGMGVNPNFPPVYAGIGVANPSEINVPMRPFTGVLYPSLWPLFHNGPFCFFRMDTIDIQVGDFRSWTMNSNPNNPAPVVRGDWPGLTASITNNTAGPVVFNDVSFGMWAR